MVAQKSRVAVIAVLAASACTACSAEERRLTMMKSAVVVGCRGWPADMAMVLQQFEQLPVAASKAVF